MGSIEGVIILSSTNEPILHSHFLHPLSNYPLLHADQLAAKIEGSAEKDILPITFAEGLAHLSLEESGDDEEEDEEAAAGKGHGNVEEGDSSREGGARGHHVGSALVHIRHNQLRLAATFSDHVDPLLPLSFLNNLVSILQLYLGAPVTEDSIRDNFNVVYQILEEMLDESGQPLNTEYNTLRDLVKEPSWFNSVMGKMASVPGLGSSATPAHINNIPWRRSLQATARTSRHEIYVDIVDVIRGSFSRGPSPKPLANVHLHGVIECNGKLGGTPDLCLRLSNSSMITAPSLHPCVRVKRWKKEGVFSFVPPDGNFTLAEYDLEPSAKLEKQVPISLQCAHQWDSSKEAKVFTIEVSAQQSAVESIEVSFDVKDKSCTIETNVSGGTRGGSSSVGISTEDLNALKGRVVHDAKSGSIRWMIDRLESTQHPLILSGTVRSESSPRMSSAVTSTFVVPLATVSGLKVTALDVVNDVGYRPFKGVRNVLKGDIDWRW